MATTREALRRIRSVASLGKVTRAMEAVSASRMRRAQQATLASRPYAENAAEVISYLQEVSARGGWLHPLLRPSNGGIPVIVLITPDRGLTGGLVLQILRAAVRRAAELGPEVAWIVIGRKGIQFLSRVGYRLDHVFDWRARAQGRVVSGALAQPAAAGQPGAAGDLEKRVEHLPESPVQADIRALAHIVIRGYLEGRYSTVYLAYASFASLTRHPVVFDTLLPIAEPAGGESVVGEFSFEPTPDAVLEDMVPRMIEVAVYQALLDAKASEHSARMLAMRNATEATEELVASLRLAYNKARQSEITSELLDIVGGAEALRARGERQ